MKTKPYSRHRPPKLEARLLAFAVRGERAVDMRREVNRAPAVLRLRRGEFEAAALEPEHDALDARHAATHGLVQRDVLPAEAGQLLRPYAREQVEEEVEIVRTFGRLADEGYRFIAREGVPFARRLGRGGRPDSCRGVRAQVAPQDGLPEGHLKDGAHEPQSFGRLLSSLADSRRLTPGRRRRR